MSTQSATETIVSAENSQPTQVSDGAQPTTVQAPTAAAPPNGTSKPNNPAPDGNPSLFIKNLPKGVTDADIHKVFMSVGTIASIHIVQHRDTRESLGYGYINFRDPKDATTALEQLNFSLIRGEPCLLQRAVRDASARQNPAANLFIKGLDPNMDIKGFYRLFAQFGQIQSGKISRDPQGKSRGYGFVQFQDVESAEEAMSLDGVKMGDFTVTVRIFLSRQERLALLKERLKHYTNLYISNLPVGTDDDALKARFAKYGQILSAFVARNGGTLTGVGGERHLEGGTLQAFGYVNFATHEQATAAAEALHRQEIDNVTLFVVPFLSRHERALLAEENAAQQENETPHTDGATLCVKHLPVTEDDAALKARFDTFGFVVVSCEVKKDRKTGVPRGFGFVSFSTVEEAHRALAKLSDQTGHNAVQVEFARPKVPKSRQSELQNNSHHRIPNQHQPTHHPGMHPAPYPLHGIRGAPVVGYPVVYPGHPAVHGNRYNPGVPQMPVMGMPNTYSQGFGMGQLVQPQMVHPARHVRPPQDPVVPESVIGDGSSPPITAEQAVAILSEFRTLEECRIFLGNIFHPRVRACLKLALPGEDIRWKVDKVTGILIDMYTESDRALAKPPLVGALNDGDMFKRYVLWALDAIRNVGPQEEAAAEQPAAAQT